VVVDECWEWLGKGGYADKRRGIIGDVIALYDRFAELTLKSVFAHNTTISNAIKKRFRDTQNVTVLHGGTENSTLVAHSMLEVRKELGLDQEAFIVGMSNVCVGDHEDNAVFFQAFSQLVREHRHMFLLLTGPEKDYVFRIITEYGLSGQVIFAGWVDFPQYNKYLSSCDLFVLPLGNSTINAGRWPNKIGDYLCLNRPILSNPTGDVEDLVREYRIGILCEHSIDGFHTALAKALIEKKILEECSKDALYVANEILAFDKRIDRFLAIFKTELATRRRSSESPPCTRYPRHS
jgi:glycosyltransferase involved in cell wall biosynthesis